MIRKQATGHLAARWDNNPLWHGNLTRERYIAANLRSCMGNIRDGMRPKGDGTYVKNVQDDN